MTLAALTSAGDQAILTEVGRLAARGVDGVDDLLALFQHRSWTVRRAVVAGLAAGDDAALARLAKSLTTRRDHEPTIAGIVDALSAATPVADALVRGLLLQQAAPAALCDAIQVAGRRHDRGSVPRLIELTEHVDDNVVLAAIEALGRIGGSEASARLLALAGDSNFFRAFPAIQVLGLAREARAVPLLRTLLLRPLYATEAARALGRIGNGPAAEALVDALDAASDSSLRALAAGLVAIQHAAEASPNADSVVSRAVRRRGMPSLRSKVMRALAFADGDEAVALGRLLIWLADEESVTDFLPLLSASDEMSNLALDGLRRLEAFEDPRVLALLQTGGSELRARLLPALAGLTSATAAITHCLSDPQASVRAMACHALARGRATSEVPRLFQLLADGDLGVVHAAIGAIQSLGSDETPALAATALRSTASGERHAALRILMYFGHPGSLAIALEAINSDDERAREIALSGLPALDEPGIADVLLTVTRHASARTRASAARALGRIASTPETEQRLITLLGDTDAWVRYYACQALGKLHAAAALPLMTGLLDDPAGQVQMAAVEALAIIPGEAAARALLSAADSPNVEVQRAALVGMGARREPSHRSVLETAMTGGDEATRLVALSSLASFPGTEAILERIAGDDASATVRNAAVELLAAHDDALATQGLIRLLRRDLTWAEPRAALAHSLDRRLPTLLGMLGDADGGLAVALVAILVASESRACRAALDVAFESENTEVRRAVARALSRIWDDSAKAALARAATLDTDAQVRQICAAALS